MGVPFFVANGSAVATITTTLSLVAPTLLDGDCLIAVIATNDNVAPSGFDTRWVTVGSNPSGAGLQSSVYYLPDCKAADSGATFAFTVAGTTVAFGQLSVYRQVARFTQKLNRTVSANTSSATITWGAVVQQEDNSLLLAAFGYAKNGVTDGGISAGTPTFTNRYISTTATGGTESIGLYDGKAFATSNSGTRTMATGAVAAVSVGTIFELAGDHEGTSPGNAGCRFPSITRVRGGTGRAAGDPPPY